MDGCDPYLILGTKIGKVLTDVEPMDFLSQSPVLDTPVALGELAILKNPSPKPHRMEY